MATRNRNPGRHGIAIPSNSVETKADRRNNHLYDEIKDLLTDLNSRMEDDSSVYELIEQLDEIKQNAKVKQFELELLETLAWTSSETAVVDARKNLFTATKLCHFQFIAEAVEAWQEDNFLLDNYEDATSDQPEDYVSRHDWVRGFSNFIHTMRNRIFRKKSTREQIKQYIQNF